MPPFFHYFVYFLSSRLAKRLVLELFIILLFNHLKKRFLLRSENNFSLKKLIKCFYWSSILLSLSINFNSEIFILKNKIMSILLVLLENYFKTKKIDSYIVKDLEPSVLLEIANKTNQLVKNKPVLFKDSPLKITVPQNLYLLREEFCLTPLCRKLLTESIQFKNRLISYMESFNSIKNSRILKEISVQSSETILNKILTSSQTLTSNLKNIPKEEGARRFFLKDLQFILSRLKDEKDNLKFYTPEMHKTFKEEFVPQILYLIDKVDKDISFYILLITKK